MPTLAADPVDVTACLMAGEASGRPQAWLRAGRLWVFEARFHQCGRVDQYRRRLLVDQVVGGFARTREAGWFPPVLHGHGLADNGAGRVGELGVVFDVAVVDGWVHAWAVSCIAPTIGWGVSARYRVLTLEADRLVADEVEAFSELSLLPPPIEPAVPGAQVLAVAEVPAADVAAWQARAGRDA